MIDGVEERWRQLLSRGETGWLEVDAESLLRMLIGVSPVGRPYFALIVSQKPGLPDLTGTIEVTRRQRVTDGRWTLTLELQVHALTDAFVSLLSDLAAKSVPVASEREALEVFLDTLADWRDLLTTRTDRLSENALRGLIAELWFGFESQAHQHPELEAARAWAGPLNGVQDFQFPVPSHHFEVKSLRPGRTSVEISSEQQLDGGNIKLAVVTIEEVSAPSDGITLPGLVTSIRSRLKDGADRSEFNRRFARLFVNLDDAWYSQHLYEVRRLQIFNVTEEFPALRGSQLPKAIARTTYWLDIQYLQRFLESDMNYLHGSGPRDG